LTDIADNFLRSTASPSETRRLATGFLHMASGERKLPESGERQLMHPNETFTMKLLFPKLLCISLAWLAAAKSATLISAEYDPLVIAGDAEIRTVDFEVQDAARDREIPIKVYLPPQPKAAPVILFSHGLGGSREGYAYVGQHWAKRGYVVVMLQHPGSDESVWRGRPLGGRMQAMHDAASGENLLLRLKDVPAVLDQLAKWNVDEKHSLNHRLDLEHVGMSGHSFGAQTTQGVAGQSNPLNGNRFTDARIDAALPMSPSTPRRGDTKRSFGEVKIPWLLMTGTKDVSPIGGQTVESRLAVFPALPAGDKYQLVLDGAEHSAFGGGREGQRLQLRNRNPNHHRAILALSTAFWDAYLREDVAAKRWLTGEGPRGVLEKDDQWEQK
jgi:predicted dienelactone hydrolase